MLTLLRQLHYGSEQKCQCSYSNGVYIRTIQVDQKVGLDIQKSKAIFMKVHAWNHVTEHQRERDLWLTYQSILNLNDFDISNNRTCKLFFGFNRICDLTIPVPCSSPPGSYVQESKLLFTSYCSDGSINCGLHHCTAMQYSIFSVHSP